MATFNKYTTFAQALGSGAINLTTDTLKIVLSNTAPDAATDAALASLAEITAGNGYTAGGETLAGVSLTAGVLSATDEVITASGGDIGPFRYAILHDSTANQAIGYWDYGSSASITDTNTLTVDFGASILTIA